MISNSRFRALVLLLVSASVAHAQEGGEEGSSEVSVTGDQVTVTVTVTPAEKPGDEESSSFSAVVGVGALFPFDDAVDFYSTENYLFVKNNSTWRPSVSPGLMVSFSERYALVLTPHFAARTNAVFDGVLIGFAIKGGPAHWGAGYVFRWGQELAPGFRRRLPDAIREHPDVLAHFADACGDSLTCRGNRDVDTALDGFPLKLDGKRIFPGNPITQSINKGVFFGVFVPFSLRDLFR